MTQWKTKYLRLPGYYPKPWPQMTDEEIQTWIFQQIVLSIYDHRTKLHTFMGQPFQEETVEEVVSVWNMMKTPNREANLGILADELWQDLAETKRGGFGRGRLERILAMPVPKDVEKFCA